MTPGITIILFTYSMGIIVRSDGMTGIPITEVRNAWQLRAEMWTHPVPSSLLYTNRNPKEFSVVITRKIVQMPTNTDQ